MTEHCTCAHLGCAKAFRTPKGPSTLEVLKSAENLDEKGSSETIRETTFDFSRYEQVQVSHKKTIDRSFLEWFVGFSEGDGSFVTSGSRLFFVINQKEEKVLRLVRSNLGFGKVSLYNGFYRYIVANRENTDRLVALFNGNLVLKRTNSRFLSWLNTRNLCSECKVLPLPPNRGMSLSKSAWLSGLVDADGCFNVSKQADSRYSLRWRVRLRFVIDQKEERGALERVKSFLGGGNISESAPPAGMLRFTSFSLSSHRVLVEYLSRFPLRSKKKIDYVRWLRVKGYIERRKAQPWEGKILERVERLIKNTKGVDDRVQGLDES